MNDTPANGFSTGLALARPACAKVVETLAGTGWL
jgi:hypothetical protein